MQLLASSDGVTVALHDLGGVGAPLLVSHATGFHGRAYGPIATALADHFHAHALDYRGHGESTQPHGWAGEPVDWRGFGDDALVAAEAIAPGGGLTGFGHSMGGAALLMAAAHRPGLFDRLVLFEPIVYPAPPLPADPSTLPIVQGARRRRARFASSAAAIDNYRAKPPLSTFDDDVLQAYVEHGFRQVATEEGDGIELRCTPAFEAAVFEGSFSHGVWDQLAAIETPTLIVVGAVDSDQASRYGAAVAEALPNGRYLELPHLTHFGPFNHVAEIAELVLSG